MSPNSPVKTTTYGVTPIDSPTVSHPSFTAPENAPNLDFIKWAQNPEDTSYSHLQGYNTLNTSAPNSTMQSSTDQPLSQTSSQLARRPLNQQLVQTGHRNFDGSGSWVSFANDTSILDSHDSNGIKEENYSIEALEEKAAIAKRDAQAKRKQIPPFVQKLSSFLEESRNTDLIRWSERGDSFVVLDEDEFAKTLIPELFKHNNYASFVRQLNMYGFHKRVGLSDNSMKASERKNKSPSEYFNPYFKRSHQNLLWLIKKPKGSNNKNKKKIKELENFQIESDEEKDIEEIQRNSTQNARALSAAPESNSLQRRDAIILHSQLAEIQQQQNVINNTIQRLRKDHNTLYQQSIAFQSLHDRHENSISAILTFLATVYNRSLDGQNLPSFSQMFSTSIPHNDQQHPVSVVNIGNVSDQQDKSPGSMSPLKKAQRLLMAPPVHKKRAGSIGTTNLSLSPSDARNENLLSEDAQPTSAKEILESSFCDSSNPTRSPSLSISSISTVQQANMMSIINDANAANSDSPMNGMEFPEILSHYENSGGISPLTSEQRNTMLSLIAHGSTSSVNNSPVSPNPQSSLHLEEIKHTNNEIDNLLRLNIEQDAKLGDVKAILEPISPSSLGPSVQQPDFFASDVPNCNLDLDQLLDTSEFFTGNCEVPGGDGDPYEYNEFGDNTFCMDIENAVGMKPENLDSIDAELLAQKDDEEDDMKADISNNNKRSSGSSSSLNTQSSGKMTTPPSPSKRRRCN